MSINACSINAHTINAACGAYSVLSSTVLNYTVTLTQGQIVPLTDIGDFIGGPITAIVIASGALNGPGGSLAFSTDLGPAGNIYFGGTATGNLGAYTGQVRLYGTINFVTINFLVQVVQAVTGDKPHPQHVHPDTKVPLNIFRRQPEPEEEPIDLSKVEQEYVRVEVELVGAVYGETLRRAVTDDLTFITVNGLTIDGPTVNITDLKLKKV